MPGQHLEWAMYTAFYGFQEKPFALSPDPKYLFLSESHREVLGHLIYGIEQGEGFIATSGEVGTGKTTLCRTLLERLGADCEVAFLFNPHLSPLDLVRAINAEYGLPTSGTTLPELTAVLNEFLLRKNAEGRRALIIVDEAQTLSTETLEQIRLLSNLETSTSKLIQIVLLGQPELDQKLRTVELRQLRQRISVWWHLGPLSPAETREYVRHRLRIAGVGRPIFSDGALDAIHRIAGGVPRLINVLCDRALLAGYGENVTEIDRRIVSEVAKEIGPCAAPTVEPRGRWPLAWISVAAALALVGFAAGLLWNRAVGTPAPSTPDAAAETIRTAPGEPSPHAALLTPPASEDAPSASQTSDREWPEGEPSAELGSEGGLAALPAPAPPSPGPDPQAIPPALEALVPLLDKGSANAAAADAALVAWGLTPAGEAALTLAGALRLLASRGLEAQWLEVKGLADLRSFDLPALVHLRSALAGARWVLLRGTLGDRVDIEGLVPGQTARVPTAEFEALWTGEVYVLWRDFESLGSSLRPGQVGAGVTWLQSSLAELGFFEGRGDGHFDAATLEAVQAFQRSFAMSGDGIVGPLTKIRLYGSLPSYRMPALVEGELGLARSP
jgi:general secretion pathway protein A